MVLWFYGFNDLTKYSIHVFLIDIDITSKVFRILLNRSGGFSAPTASTIVNILGSPNSGVYKDNMFGNVPRFFLDFLRCLCVSRDKQYWFWGLAKG